MCPKAGTCRKSPLATYNYVEAQTKTDKLLCVIIPLILSLMMSCMQLHEYKLMPYWQYSCGDISSYMHVHVYHITAHLYSIHCKY